MIWPQPTSPALSLSTSSLLSILYPEARSDMANITVNVYLLSATHTLCILPHLSHSEVGSITILFL